MTAVRSEGNLYWRLVRRMSLPRPGIRQKNHIPYGKFQRSCTVSESELKHREVQRVSSGGSRQQEFYPIVKVPWVRNSPLEALAWIESCRAIVSMGRKSVTWLAIVSLSVSRCVKTWYLWQIDSLSPLSEVSICVCCKCIAITCT